jgi:glycosyltransferase involved in cell wall biosynthesis
MKACIVIPFYNHGNAIAHVLDALRPLAIPCFVVDDGSDAAAKAVLIKITESRTNDITVLTLSPNQGKGTAVMTGFQTALDAGYSHAVQIDADGQHRVSDIPRMLIEAARRPNAVINGEAVYDESVPRARLYGRYVTHVWVWINTLSFTIKDSMCGLRVYPLESACRIWRKHGKRMGKRMDFDPEIIVRMAWAGVPIVNFPTPVTYAADGVSHFKMFRDNVLISYMHARLFFGMLWRLPMLLARRLGVRSGESET